MTKKAESDDSFPEMLRHLADELGALVRNDLEAARAEMVEKAKAAGMGAGMLSGSAIAAVFALFSLTILAIVGLSAAVPLWAAALIVTAIWSAVTLGLALAGKRKLQEAGPPLPEHTIAHVKEDIEAAKRDVAAALHP